MSPGVKEFLGNIAMMFGPPVLPARVLRSSSEAVYRLYCLIVERIGEASSLELFGDSYSLTLVWKAGVGSFHIKTSETEDALIVLNRDEAWLHKVKGDVSPTNSYMLEDDEIDALFRRINSGRVLTISDALRGELHKDLDSPINKDSMISLVEDDAQRYV